MQKKTYERVDWPCVSVTDRAIYFNKYAGEILPKLGYARILFTTDELIFEFYDRQLLMGEKLKRVVRRAHHISIYKPVDMGAMVRNGAYHLHADNGMYYIKRYEDMEGAVI